MRTQLSNILEMLLIKNSIRLHPEELKFQVSSHPSYPSLHALTGVLQHFDIPNLAIQLPTTPDILHELPQHFIAHIYEDYKNDLVLVEKTNNQVKITFDKNKSEQRSIESFLSIWDGIIVAIEKDDQVTDIPISNFNNILRWVFISITFLSIGYFTLLLPDTFAKGHFILSIIGLIFSTLIIRHELGLESSILEDFCNLSSSTSCDASLNSKGALLFGRLKLSDLSIMTFSTYIISWILFFKDDLYGYSPISMITLLAIPFTFYSLYYQYKVVKKWCPLCLGIVAVLLLQAALLLSSNFTLESISVEWKPMLLLVLSGILCAGVWSIIGPLIERKVELEKLEIEHYKFKRNYSLFKTLHDKGRALVTPYIPIKGEICLGNKDAPIEVVLITSSMCLYCKEAHADIIKILEKAKNKISVAIRFTVNIENKEELNYLISSRLIQIYNTKSAKDIDQALEEVFAEHVDREKWLEQHNEPLDSQYDIVLQKQSDWCNENRINFTPAFYVNGKMFPREYDRTDLIYFIEDLAEQYEVDNPINNLTVAG